MLVPVLRGFVFFFPLMHKIAPSNSGIFGSLSDTRGKYS